MGKTTTVTLGMDPDAPLLTLELSDIDEWGADGGALAWSGGNLYIYVDGEEYGSLFFNRPEPGTPVAVTLGAYDPAERDWIDHGTLAGPTGRVLYKEGDQHG